MSQGSITTPGLGSQDGGSQSSSQNDFCTPKQYRNRRLDILKNENTPKSPILTIPASPAMIRLGYGTGVGVYLMERSPRSSGEVRSPWAIKKISKIRQEKEYKELYSRRLEFEAEILRNLCHLNIIGYRGFGNPSNDMAFLAMEKASKSLGDLIEERVEELTPNGVIPFPAARIKKVAEDIAQALTYLHEMKKLIHGDLKSGNVLIFGEFEIAKLCDFGVSRKILNDGLIDGRYVGTEIWNPMEVLLLNRGQKGHPVTAKADIYPFGLTLHEMISLKPPHFSTAEDDYSETITDTGSDNSDNDFFDEQAFDSALQRQLGKRPTLPDFEFDESYNNVLGVFYCCTEENPEDRPTASQILSILNSDKNENECKITTLV